MWQKKTKINVIPINVTVNILLIKHQPKMDDLLIANAYENQTTGMDTVTQNWSRSLLRAF